MTALGETVQLSQLLALEEIDQDLYRAPLVSDRAGTLYGGQVAAQALVAAGATVDGNRLAHSIHGYFLRPGDPARPVVYRVDRDRDGRSFSARRVIALQRGEVIFNMSVSFHVEEPGEVREAAAAPDTADPETLPVAPGTSLASMDIRLPEQPYPDAAWPSRFWARCTDDDLGDDPLIHLCVLTYVSDLWSGVAPIAGRDETPGPSLDHAVWFHRPLRADEWMLVDLVPQVAGRGRGFYSGTVRTRGGDPVASLVQESLLRGVRAGSAPKSRPGRT